MYTIHTGRFTPTSLSLLSLFELSFSSADESRLKKRKEHFRLTAMGPTSHRPAAIGYALSPKKTFPKKYKNIKKKPVGAEREVNNNSISTENSSIYHAHTPARRPACVSLQVFFTKNKNKKVEDPYINIYKEIGGRYNIGRRGGLKTNKQNRRTEVKLL